MKKSKFALAVIGLLWLTMASTALAMTPVHSNQSHELLLITNGSAALQARLEMIERAQTSVAIESYLLVADSSGKFLLQALQKRAKAGVKVRILCDLLDQALDPFLATVLAEDGIEVKYYRPSSMAKLWVSKGHRNHRKTFIVDGREMIVGGRNSADRYMDIPNHRNFLFVDYELAVKGPIVEDVLASFNEYWSSPLSEKVAASRHPSKGPSWSSINSSNPSEREWQARQFLVESPEDQALRLQVATLGIKALEASPTFESKSLWWVGDEPMNSDSSRKVQGFVLDHIIQAQHSFSAEEWAFITTPEMEQALDQLLTKKVRIEILTNSYPSASDPILTHIAHPIEARWVQKGVRILELQAIPVPGSNMSAPPGTRFGTHAKTFVIDGKDTFIGSYNFDPRSQNINSEDGLYIENLPELAKAVEQTMKTRMSVAWEMNAKGEYVNGPPVDQTIPKGERFKTHVLGGLAEYLRGLF
ncbi:MAG: hypothetical protein JSU04_08345 [Bdellovibrionales bacterium]|nr:hypothetical protein [Bdellovibrionales bacterium]